MKVNGYELVSEWKTSQCGWTARAKKGGSLYFLKQYQTPAAPLKNGTLDAKTFAHNQKLFDHFLETRKTVNSRIRTITGAGGNIVIPADEFMLDNHYVEAAEFVDGIVPEEELERVLSGLSVDVKKLLMQTAAGALSSVHKLGIVHSDLKLKNVLLVKNAAGNYVAKLIDFDSSYPVDDKPDEIVGDINYYSPELGSYADIEDDDERAEAGRKLTEKSDIFSLGLIFHFYLSGEMPGFKDLPEKLKKRQEKGKKIYCWAALNAGASLVLNPAIGGPKYRSLIEDMLKLSPEERPTALDVLKRLKGEDTVFEEPWPEHAFTLDRDRIKSRGFVSVCRKTMGDIKGYQFYKPDGTSNFFKADMLIAMKFAVSAGTAAAKPAADHGTSSRTVSTAAPTAKPVAKEDACEPWPEHGIVFDAEVIRAKGFTGMTQATLGGVKGYEFTRNDGGKQFMRVEMLIVQKMAKKA